MLGASCATGLISYAADAATYTSYEDSLPTVLKEVEVKGSRQASQLSSGTPAPRLTAETITSTGVSDISDAMRRLPGVNLSDQGGSGSEKTIAVRGLGSQHTAIIYDGFPISDIRRGAIDISRFSLNNVKELKVNIGDSDGIFIPARAASSASSLEITTLAYPESTSTDLELDASLRGGSFGLINPSARLAKSNGRNLSFSLATDYLHANNDYPYQLDNGTHTVTEKRQNSSLESGHIELNGIWRPRPWNSLTAKGYFYSTDRHLPGPALYYTEESHERLGEMNSFGQVSFRTRLPKSFSLRTAARFNWSHTRYRDENGKYPDGRLDQRYRQREAYATGAVLYSPINSLSFDYSVDYFFNDLESNLIDNSSPYRHSLLQLLAAQWKNKIVKIAVKGLLSIYRNGSRKGEEAGGNHSRVSPSASISVKPIENRDLYFRASYKNIFRLPTFNELYFDHFGSINLNPEETDQINLGATWGYEHGALEYLRITADGYFNRVRNKIVAVPYNMFVNTMTNLGKVYGYGADVSLAAEISLGKRQSIEITGAWSYQRAAIRTSPDRLDWKKQVAYTPYHTGSGSMTWHNPWVNAVFHFVATGERYATSINLPTSRMAGYIDCGFTLYRTFPIGSHSLELRADLLNAFNRRYELVARYPMPGRSWQATISFSL